MDLLVIQVSEIVCEWILRGYVFDSERAIDWLIFYSDWKYYIFGIDSVSWYEVCVVSWMESMTFYELIIFFMNFEKILTYFISV